MRITILDGDTRGGATALDAELESLQAQAKARGDECVRLPLAQMDLHQCRGCFNCWLKTPGLCRLRDDGARLLQAFVQSDLVVFASPMRMGFTTALLKRATDRIVPIVLPYVRVVDGECHHCLRYGSIPEVGLILERADATDEELEATETIYRRLAKNLDCRIAYVRVLAQSKQEERHAMDAA